MQRKLREAAKQAAAYANRLSFSLQEIERNLIFVGFKEDDLPQVTMCNGEEIIAVYRGSEIDVPTFIEIMEERGYIMKEDFIL